jgi:nitroreductase
MEMSISSTVKLAVFGTMHQPKWPRFAYYFIVNIPKIYIETLKDCTRYLRFSASLGIRSRKNLVARITESFHNIEKGLSLANPRAGFGERAIHALLTLCNEHLDRYGSDERVLYSARDVLARYCAFNASLGATEYPHKKRIEDYVARIGSDSEQRPPFGGLRRMAKTELDAITGRVTSEFFMQRHSVRQFSEREVDKGLIEEAVRIALKAPAVCNRQYSRAVVITGERNVQDILTLQGGARGFAEQVNKVIVVTTPLSHFWGAEERNQAWIDGGLFAMSLLLGLHALGLGACALNWSKLNSQTEKMRRFLGLNEDEVIIMMVAVGHLRDKFDVALSHRVDIEDSLRILDGERETR